VAAEPYDETRHHTGVYRTLLRGTDLAGLSAAVQEALDDAGCSFGGEQRFVVDPVPRLLHGAEWDALERGLGQRVTALEAFVADVYGERRIVREGVVPERVIAGAVHHQPEVAGIAVGTWITVAGLDLVRREDGRFAVLEDNVRTPSGLAYLQAARDAVGSRVAIPAGRRLRTVDGHAPALRRALEAATPAEDPYVVLLTDGPANTAHWEHCALAEAVGVPLVTADRLRRDGDRLLHGGRQVDVVYRRTENERLTELLEAPLRAGRLAVANAFGTGVADDKLVHAYVEDMVRFYLGEEPELPSVRTFDLHDPAVREEALDRLAEIVVKPRSGHGGRGVVIGPQATAAELRLVRDAIRETPDQFVAQELIMLSRHPTVAADGLAPRHVDLRPFVISGGGERHVVPGGLTRVALEEGEMIVNSSRNGGAKDTWVLD
jgi:uncharacterized circularly permuted ATP-grasp superfamily protein